QCVEDADGTEREPRDAGPQRSLRAALAERAGEHEHGDKGDQPQCRADQHGLAVIRLHGSRVRPALGILQPQAHAPTLPAFGFKLSGCRVARHERIETSTAYMQEDVDTRARSSRATRPMETRCVVLLSW